MRTKRIMTVIVTVQQDMMEHMQAGQAPMAMCPMMKQMGGMMN
jgi:hypothetical protein